MSPDTIEEEARSLARSCNRRPDPQWELAGQIRILRGTAGWSASEVARIERRARSLIQEPVSEHPGVDNPVINPVMGAGPERLAGPN